MFAAAFIEDALLDKGYSPTISIENVEGVPVLKIADGPYSASVFVDPAFVYKGQEGVRLVVQKSSNYDMWLFWESDHPGTNKVFFVDAGWWLDSIPYTPTGGDGEYDPELFKTWGRP